MRSLRVTWLSSKRVIKGFTKNYFQDICLMLVRFNSKAPKISISSSSANLRTMRCASGPKLGGSVKETNLSRREPI